MSLYLGKIHYWLYNKILWFEGIEEELVQYARKQGLPIEEWRKDVYEKYGAPTEGKPLEEIIDTSNIHGWLQQRITSAELRQAALVTGILDTKPESKEKLISIFTEQGKSAAREYGERVGTPEDAYHALNDFILEGMPCDRVNEVVTSNEREFTWETTTCLHTPYWEEVKGEVRNFYELREAWIRAFVSSLNPGLKYEKSPEGIHKIVKQ